MAKSIMSNIIFIHIMQNNTDIYNCSIITTEIGAETELSKQELRELERGKGDDVGGLAF